MKIGIIFYSRTGNTRSIAKLLENKFKEEKADAELIEIEHVKKPGFFKAGRAAMKQQEVPIKNTDFDLKKYDFIIAGTPTWAGRPSPYIKTFMNKAENVNGKKSAFFLTGATPIEDRKKATSIIRNDLENVGLKTIIDPLLLRMRKEEIIDGKQNIDGFINAVLSK
jgi:flavodoxin